MDEPVTVIVRRRVKPDAVHDFEQWQSDINAACARFEGHLGLEVIRPENPRTQDYVIIFRFDTKEHLDAWEDSKVRHDLVTRAESMTEHVVMERVSGLEHWFSIKVEGGPPPRYKMVIVTVFGIYPLVMFVAPAITRELGSIPHAIATLASSVVLVLLMTYVMMPLMSRIFAGWLYPRRRT